MRDQDDMHVWKQYRALFERAIFSHDDITRIQVLELICCSPRASSLLTHMEIDLLLQAIPLNMRSVAGTFRTRWLSAFRQLCARLFAAHRMAKVREW